MEKQSFARRMMFPAAMVLAFMVVSINLYDIIRFMQRGTIRSFLLYLSVAGMFLSIWLGALYSNSVAFARGASQGERILVSITTPLIWIIKTYTHFIGIYSFTELIYLILHPFIIGNIGVTMLCIGISELICRLRYRGRIDKMNIRVFQPVNTTLLFLGLVISIMGLWNGGHTYYYHYMDIYSALFL